MSKNDVDVLSALDAVRGQTLESFLLPILNILKTYPKQLVRTFALLLLVAKKYDKKVEFLHEDKLIVITTINVPKAKMAFITLTASDAT